MEPVERLANDLAALARSPEHWWVPSGYESLYATALVESPAPIAVREPKRVRPSWLHQ